MSVLINMEMSESCAACPLEKCEENYYGDIMNRECCLIYKGYTSEYRHKRREDCPLVEVPPHGRLIDTDSTVEVELYDDEHEEWKTKFMSVETYLGYCYNEVPTIIEAEGTEHD